MGVSREGSWSPWIFIHETDKVEGCLTVLFFGLIFSVGPPSGNFSADALVKEHNYPVSMPLYDSSIPTGTDARTEVK